MRGNSGAPQRYELAVTSQNGTVPAPIFRRQQFLQPRVRLLKVLQASAEALLPRVYRSLSDLIPLGNQREQIPIRVPDEFVRPLPFRGQSLKYDLVRKPGSSRSSLVGQPLAHSVNLDPACFSSWALSRRALTQGAHPGMGMA